jgi:hypothetical protein
MRNFYSALVKRMNSFFLKIEKRLRFVISALISSLLLLVSTFFFFDTAIFFIPLFILVTYFLVYFSIVEGIDKSEWLTLFIIPVIFSVAFYLFYFLFPVRWLTRVPFIAIYAVAIYAVLLTSNIFNVGVEKSLQLYRAAFSVNYFVQTIIVFLIANILFSARQNFLVNSLIIGVSVFPLSFQLFWTIKLDLEINRDLFLYAAFTAVVLAQLVLVLSFVPFRPAILALITTASYYSVSGLITAFLDARLFKQTVREYLIVLGVVAVIALLTLNW